MKAVSDSDQLATDVAWNLEPLLGETGSVDSLLAEAAEAAEKFSEKYRGRIAYLSASDLAEAMHALAQISDGVGRVGSYVGLKFSVDTTNPEFGAQMANADEKSTEISNTLLFVELEWAAADDAHVEEILTQPELDFCRHHLSAARRYRPHLLSEPEEKILADKAVTGSSAWGRLFSELTSTIEVDISGETISLEEGLSRLQSPERPVRKEAALAVTCALEPGLRTRAFIFNTLLADKGSDDRLRHFDNWLASRNLDNEASDESVAALVEAVVSRYDIPQRWYTLKAKLLGLDRIFDYDRMALVSDTEETFSWSAAREIVSNAYKSFSPELSDVVERFFNEKWIDAPQRPGKRSGAFCAYTVPDHHPYLLLNWTGRRRDVLTLAHELGHGLHAYLAREQGVFHQNTPLTLAETASVFGETVTFGRLLSETNEPNQRLALLAESLEGQIATVFRQVAMNQFEDSAHTWRREQGEVSVEQFGDLWISSQSDMLGDSVELTEGYRSWWSYIPHFIGTPGYVYAYAYGQLLALSVYQLYEERGTSFVDSYLELLRQGGSKSPQELGHIVGVDLSDPTFWDGGLSIIEEQLNAAEQAALTAQRITLP